MQLTKGVVLAIIMSFVYGCAGPVHKAEDGTNYDKASMEAIKQHRVTLDKLDNLQNTSIDYFTIGKSTGTPVLMVHGTPGSWSAFRYVMGEQQLQKEFHLASTNRLGWNNDAQEKLSSFEGDASNFKVQAAALAEVIKHFSPKQKVILVGHSLGASIIPRVALDYPELVAGMLLISGTIDPKLGTMRWYNNAAKFNVVKMMLPKRFNLANQEIVQLKTNLEEQSSVWNELAIPVSVIQGGRDKLVSPENIKFAQKKLSYLNNNLQLYELKKAGHFTIWENIATVSKALLDLKFKIEK